jgi:hypothetical protein
MKRVYLAVAALISATALSGTASATPLRMDYSVNPLGGGVYHYAFTLTLDNHDGTWSGGQGWRWLIFGDTPSPGPTNLTGFVGDPSSIVGGPWTGFTSSSGGHNGPTMDFVLDYWVPTGIGSTVRWQGNATANLADGTLAFSTIAGTQGGGIPADYELAHLTTVPEPASMAALGLGVLALIRRRRTNAK